MKKRVVFHTMITRAEDEWIFEKHYYGCETSRYIMVWDYSDFGNQLPMDWKWSDPPLDLNPIEIIWEDL